MSRKTLAAALLVASTTGAFASDLSLEPCINGDVSASGNFPSQAMEEQFHAYLNWRSQAPALASEAIAPLLGDGHSTSVAQ
jgi:hypothetical protein